VRIAIAQSGDLAYEFSNSEVVFDLKNGERETAVPASVLRVWKKDRGQWKMAAMFARPLYQDSSSLDAK
jgi:ketosteroid isomerase-like protein